MKYNYKPTYVDRKHHFADCVTWPSPPQPLLAPGKRNAKDVPADTHGNVVRLQLGVTWQGDILPSFGKPWVGISWHWFNQRVIVSATNGGCFICS